MQFPAALALTLAFLLGAAIVGAADAPARSWTLTDDATIRSRLEHYVDEARLAPGVVVGVYEAAAPPSRQFRYFTSGRSGREGVELSPDTLFEVGSITKGFTALLLGEMVQQNELRLDATLGEVLPQRTWPADVDGLTLRQLAQHRSGLPRLALSPAHLLPMIVSRDPYAGSIPEDVFAAATHTPGRKAPGEYLYSNLGYALLGQVLAERSGTDFHSLVTTRILHPYGLPDAYLTPADAPKDRLARGFSANHRPAPPWHLDGYVPAGGLVTSARALTEFLAKMHRAPTEAWQLAVTTLPGPTRPDRNQTALGWVVRPREHAQLVWHNGGTGGFRTFAGLVPEEGIALVVLTNGHGNADALALSLLDPNLKPPSAAPFRWSSVGPMVALLMGPVLIAGSRRARPRLKRALDRLDAVHMLATAAFLLCVAERFGPWHRLPFLLWWVAVALAAILALDLLRQLPGRPWVTGSGWSRATRGVSSAFWLSLTAFLL